LTAAGQDDDELSGECRTFTRYLLAREPTPYVVRKYVEAHRILDVLHPSGSFDRLLLSMARGPAILRWPASAFARLFAPESALQSKLVTLLAILETDPETGRQIDAPPVSNAAVLVLLLTARGLLAALSLAAGIALLLPLRGLLAGRRTTGG
jgi:hypothetical protein